MRGDSAPVAGESLENVEIRHFRGAAPRPVHCVAPFGRLTAALAGEQLAWSK
jgi:hypothetical protein